jgi:hypothetical protein
MTRRPNPGLIKCMINPEAFLEDYRSMSKCMELFLFFNFEVVSLIFHQEEERKARVYPVSMQ